MKKRVLQADIKRSWSKDRLVVPYHAAKGEDARAGSPPSRIISE